MDLGLKEKKVLITGGTSGIGYAAAKEFRREGAFVTVVGRTHILYEVANQDWENTFNEKLCFQQLDVSGPSAANELYRCSGVVDILINNASNVPSGYLEDFTAEDIEKAFNSKMMAYIKIMSEYLPEMIKQESGAICNVIGIAAVKPRANYALGGMCNAALKSVTHAYGARSLPQGVSVFGVNPGRTMTARLIKHLKFEEELRQKNMLSAEPLQNISFIDPEEIARMIVFGCSPLMKHLSGSVVDYDGGALYRPT